MFPNLTPVTLGSIARKIARFRRAEEGTVTVEAAIWMPFWILFTFGIGEISLLFYGQARTLDVAQQAIRSYSVGHMESEDEVSDRIKAGLSGVSEDVDVRFALIDGNATATVTVPARDLSGGIGIFSTLTKFDVTVVAQQAREF